jgi:hypothetical protein
VEPDSHDIGRILDSLPSRESVVNRDQKKNYAQEFSNRLAVKFAEALRPRYPNILPSAVGPKNEPQMLGAKGYKKTDVNYSRASEGLGFLISIKTLNFPDGKNGRYTKNMVRIDHELRAEAMDMHERFPFACIFGCIFLPIDACDHGSYREPSSFGHAVRTFRRRIGRKEPWDPIHLFEAIFLGLYEHTGEDRGSVIYFDVADTPKWAGRPSSDRAKRFIDMLDRMVEIYRSRSFEIEWEDGSRPSRPVNPKKREQAQP